jgi:acyl-CoA thioester hydrolase
MASELLQYRDTVRSEWVDYNGHLRDAFYLLIFSFATDALMEHIGLDVAGRARSHSSIYTLESHINYLQEVKLGTEVLVRTQLLGSDAKRLHIYHAMEVLDGDGPVAVSEQMLLHVDVRGPKSAPFTPDVLARVQAIRVGHSALARPQYVGRVMRLP